AAFLLSLPFEKDVVAECNLRMGLPFAGSGGFFGRLNVALDLDLEPVFGFPALVRRSVSLNPRRFLDDDFHILDLHLLLFHAGGRGSPLSESLRSGIHKAPKGKNKGRKQESKLLHGRRIRIFREDGEISASR